MADARAGPGGRPRPPRLRRRPPPRATVTVALLGLGTWIALGACFDPIPVGTLIPGRASVQGVVTQRCGGPLAGANVQLDYTLAATTDDNGHYHIDSVAVNTDHVITVVLPGGDFINEETRIRLAPGESAQQNLALELPGGDATQPIVLDVLFVIDNGPDMDGPQQALVAAFPAFADHLTQLAQRKPTPVSLRLGFISTDLGAGPDMLSDCTVDGDKGLLQTKRNDAEACALGSIPAYRSDEHYLTLISDGAGGSATNFTGTLAEAFACHARLGTAGCRFAMPLAATNLALASDSANNFVRSGSTLLIIVVTASDDCSALQVPGVPGGTELFDIFQGARDTLGPLSRYRCFEFGTLCGGAKPGEEVGARTGCVPGKPGAEPDDDPTHQLTPVATYAQLLQDPRFGGRALLGVIAGPPAPIGVGLDPEGSPYLLASCAATGISATPALRLEALASSVSQTNRSSICRDFSVDLANWAQQAFDVAVNSRSCE